MTLSSSNIATAISALSVSGVNVIYTLANAPMEMKRGRLPAMAPDLDNWGNDNAVEQAGGQTFGPPGSRFWHVTRTLGYILYESAVGSQRNNPYQEQAVVSGIKDALIEALLELSVSGVDVVNITSGQQAIVNDLAGNQYNGMRIGVTVREEVNP